MTTLIRPERRLTALCAATVAVMASGCGSQEFTWAFAQDIDNSFRANEFCRESLAASIYDTATRDRVARQGATNVFVYSGVSESYRIYAFRSQTECETALTSMRTRLGR